MHPVAPVSQSFPEHSINSQTACYVLVLYPFPSMSIHYFVLFFLWYTESQKKEETKGKGKGTAGKHRRLTRKSSASFDDDAGRRHSWHDEDDETFDESPEL